MMDWSDDRGLVPRQKLKITAAMLIDALVQADVVYLNDDGIHNCMKDWVDLRPLIEKAAEILSQQTEE
jgi:hypothetical protein